MQVFMCLYTQNRVSTSTTNNCTEVICEETNLFKHKYYFPRTLSAQRQEVLLKYVLQIAKKSYQDNTAEMQAKGKE